MFCIFTEYDFIHKYFYSTGEDMTKWTEDDGGHDYQLVSAIAEWLMVLSIGLYFITFTGEFRLVHFKEPVIIIKDA